MNLQETNPNPPSSTPTPVNQTPSEPTFPVEEHLSEADDNPANNPQLPPPQSHSDHCRKGKVARLPYVLREKINLMLRDGIPYANLIQKLGADAAGLTCDNLSRWRAGGYQDWLQQQDWLEQAQAKLEFAHKIVSQDNGGLLNEASLRIALSRMYNLLLQFDPLVLKDSLGESPGAYSRLLNALCKLIDGALRLERYRDDQKLSNPTLFT